MIEWLNQNQGFVMALLTLVYVCATIFLAFLTLKTKQIGEDAREISREAKEISNKALEISENHLKLIADLEKQRVRPYVLFNLYNDDGKTFATVKNYGLTSASDVKISIEPKLVNTSSDDESILASQTIFFMPPSFEIKDNIGLSHVFYQNFEQAKFRGKVNYKDAFGNGYENNFYIDLDILRRRIYTKEIFGKEIVEELKQINENISNLSSK